MKKLILVDGSGYLFRAYYWLPELTNAKGEKVHAIYGFLRMLFKVFHEKPDYFVLAWDAPHKTIRHEQFADYKGQRPELPDDFKVQIRATKDIIHELAINYQEIPGYEADDIIATLAQRGEKEGHKVSIMTSDKDMKALITDNITCIDPLKWLQHTKTTFMQERGFEPIYMIDYLSIIGDSSDNIPGVKWVWPKWAIWLVQQYHTIENIYDNIDQIAPALKEKMLASKDLAFQGKSLVQLMDVPSLIEKPREDFATNLSFSHFRDVLINQYQFTSMEKNIKELQDMYEKPQQVSLFG